MDHRTSEQSAELFRLVVENVEDFAVFATDLEGHILSWNPGVKRLLGYSEEDWVGQDACVIFTHDEETEQATAGREMRTALAEGRAEDRRWHVRKDGTRFWASGKLMLLRDREGLPRGFAKILRDATERKRDEDELERRVEERTSELRELSEAVLSEVKRRRAGEEQVKALLHRIIETQEIERRRIARDLHDDLGQLLTALRLSLDSLLDGSATRGEAEERVNRTKEIAKLVEASVDFIAWELRPAALDQLGLAAAVENFVREWSRHYQIPAEFSAVGPNGSRPKPEVETNLYRIAQEALNNIHKHAGAGHVSVLLERLDGQVVLIVEDDGKGFEPGMGVDGERGMGLLSMSERAAQVGGALEIESKPGAGTTVYARVPAGGNV